MSRPAINAKSDPGLVKAGAEMRSNMVSELPEERASARVEPDGFSPVMRIKSAASNSGAECAGEHRVMLQRRRVAIIAIDVLAEFGWYHGSFLSSHTG